MFYTWLCIKSYAFSFYLVLQLALSVYCCTQYAYKWDTFHHNTKP